MWLILLYVWARIEIWDFRPVYPLVRGVTSLDILSGNMLRVRVFLADVFYPLVRWDWVRLGSERSSGAGVGGVSRKVGNRRSPKVWKTMFQALWLRIRGDMSESVRSASTIFTEKDRVSVGIFFPQKKQAITYNISESIRIPSSHRLHTS